MEVETEVAMQELRKLVEGEKDLFVGKDDDKLLKIYLAFANNNVDKAFEKMLSVFRMKEENSDYYPYRRDPDVHDVLLKKGISQILDDRDQLGRRIYLLRLKYVPFGEFEPCQMLQVDDLWLNLAADEEETQRNGLVIIMDMEDTSWKFIKFFTPNVVRVSTAKAENIPLRHIQYHVINSGLIINALVRIVFPFLSQATKESIFFHKNLGSLHEHISASVLPEEYGGEAPPVDSRRLVREYLDTRNDRLSELLSYGYPVRTK